VYSLGKISHNGSLDEVPRKMRVDKNLFLDLGVFFEEPNFVKRFVQATPSVSSTSTKSHLYHSSKIYKMKGNEISVKTLNSSAQNWLARALTVLQVKEYGKGSKRNYLQELILLFKFYNHKDVEQISQQDIEQYILYIKQAHLVGRAKCRSVAQACSFFFKKVMPVSYIVPSHLYPKKQFVLPDILTEAQVQQLYAAPLTVKERCVVGLLYGCGMRISEVCNLRVCDIDLS
jgi:integrase